jgi:hypothetical protein
MALQYARGLREFYRAPVDLSDPTGAIRAMLANRETSFVRMLHSAVWNNPVSPYLALLRHAGLGRPELEALIAREGVEVALRALYDAGVYVTLDEFKGRTPIRRGSFELDAPAHAFDNPLARHDVTSRSGGSRSAGTRLVVDLRDILNELPARYLFKQAHGLLDRPSAAWWPAPPALGGIKNTAALLKLGIPILRWFSPTQPLFGRTAGKSAVLAITTIVGARLAGHHLPWPEHVPIADAGIIARWLAEQTAKGLRLQVGAGVSRAMRICQEARRLGLDISGHTLRASAEPLTPAKAQLIRDVGCRYCSNYTMTESGRLGVSCGDEGVPDDMHLLTYRMAVLPQPRVLQGWPEPVGALHVTVFADRMTRVMLNVETGDYGRLERRSCGCPLGAAGLDLHLHTIRSYEKLTSAGMHFMGVDLIDLIETALPGRFGGGPTDYQFVEQEEQGETRVKLVINPTVGPLAEKEVQAYVLRELERRTEAGRLMTDIWRGHDMLQIERRPPYLTSAAKIQTLHVLKSR